MIEKISKDKEVQVCIDNASNYVIAEIILMHKFLPNHIYSINQGELPYVVDSSPEATY